MRKAKRWRGHVPLALVLWVGLLARRGYSAVKDLVPLMDANSVQRTRYELDKKITLSAEPKILPTGGAWVTVSWDGVSSPGATDFVAVYSPASATPITRVPIKYKYASGASSHLSQGQGSLDFRLANLGHDYWFGFFRGNITNPVFAAKSEVLRLPLPDRPRGVHLSLTSDPSEMRVTWKGGGKSPEVHFYRAGHEHERPLVVQASTSTYTADDLCGEPAKSAGFFEPGLIHTAVMTGLQPRTTYLYRVGDEGLGSWSDEYRFTTSGGRTALLAVFADMSMAEGDGSLQPGWFSNDQGSLNTSRYLHYRSQAEDLDAAVCIGDLSYATGYLSHWDSWMEMVEPMSRRVPLMVSPGNHERDDPSVSSYHPSQSFYHGNDGGGECGVPYSALFPMPSPADDPRTDTPWYAFTVGPVRFVMASTEHDLREGSVQYDWLVQVLGSVDRRQTPWLVFMGHRPLYLDSTDDSPDPLSSSEQAAARLLRSHLEPLLNKYHVDMVLAGHHHSYQRTCKVFNGECQPPARHRGAYVAPVYVVVGMAGRRLSTNFESSLPGYFEHVDKQSFGLTLLAADDTRLTLSFVSSADGSKLDEVTLHRPGPPPAGLRGVRASHVVGVVVLALLALVLSTSLWWPAAYKQMCGGVSRARHSMLLRLNLRFKAASPTRHDELTEMTRLVPGSGSAANSSALPEPGRRQRAQQHLSTV